MSEFEALSDAVVGGVVLAYRPSSQISTAAVAGAELSLYLDRGRLDIFNPFVLRCDSGQGFSLDGLRGTRITGCAEDGPFLVLVFEARLRLMISLREEDFIGHPPACLELADNAGGR